MDRKKCLILPLSQKKEKVSNIDVLPKGDLNPHRPH